MLEYTPIQTKILALLSDGMPHSREDVRDSFTDQMDSVANVRPHISALRVKLRPIGQDIVCEMGWQCRIFYRHIRLLASPVDGRR